MYTWPSRFFIVCEIASPAYGGLAMTVIRFGGLAMTVIRFGGLAITSMVIARERSDRGNLKLRLFLEFSLSANR